MIKRCTKDDIDKIYSIEEKSFADPMKTETMLKDLDRDSYFCYALSEEDIISFISFEKVFDEGQIISVATDPRYRGKGFAKKLFHEVIKSAKENGITFFTLEVRSNNTSAIALYKSLGFKEVGLRKNYYQNPVCDALLMDLQIGDE
ncbi:MAG: ribosomal protein S18-alanine N-acetyltransferase [Clostridia bacterium]|nr:ribosomal protein S18-alanine N-acetyltransferase [Clostridia bacterium]